MRRLDLPDPRGALPPLRTPALVCPTTNGLVPHVTPDLAEDLPLYLFAGDFLSASLPPSQSYPASLASATHWVFLGPAAEFFAFEDGPVKESLRITTRNGDRAVVSKDEYYALAKRVAPQCLFAPFCPPAAHMGNRQRTLRAKLATEMVQPTEQTVLFTHASSGVKDAGLVFTCGEFNQKAEDEFRAAAAERDARHPRAVICDGHPADVQRMVAAGADLVIPRLPVAYAEGGRALCFPFSSPGGKVTLDLRSPEFEHDHTPVVAGCSCLCCTKHTRSYIHHLLNVHEMLADTLLVIHNLHHMAAFVQSIASQQPPSKTPL